MHEPHTTARDSRDWTLKPEHHDAADPKRRSCRHAARLTEDVQIGGLLIPAGPCEVDQSEHAARLFWQQDGRPRQADIDLEALRALLADGRLQRGDPA